MIILTILTILNIIETCVSTMSSLAWSQATRSDPEKKVFFAKGWFWGPWAECSCVWILLNLFCKTDLSPNHPQLFCRSFWIGNIHKIPEQGKHVPDVFRRYIMFVSHVHIYIVIYTILDYTHAYMQLHIDQETNTISRLHPNDCI